MKNFNNWNKKKIKLDGLKKYLHPKEKEVWWCSIGVNIGTEIYGKGNDFTRPILIINAENSESVIGIPLSSKLKNSNFSKIIKTINGKLHAALVGQIRIFDKRRLLTKITEIEEKEYLELQKIFEKLYKI
jgi:mRNA interferase MazF